VWFITYITGFIMGLVRLIYGAVPVHVHVPVHWIVVGGMVLGGVGIRTGVKATRQKDSAL